MNGFAIDTGTTSLLTSLASFSVAVWLFSLRSHTKLISVASRFWGWSLVLQGIGWIALAFRDMLPLAYTGIPGAIFLFVAATLQLRAYAVLTPRRRLLAANYILLVIAVLAQLFFGYVFPHGPARIAIGSAFGALLAAQCAYILFDIAHRVFLIRLLGWIYALITGVMLYRLISYIPLLGQPALDAYTLASVTHAANVSLFLNAILPSIGFVHVCAQLLDRRTQEQNENLSALEEKLSEQKSIEAGMLANFDAFLYRAAGTEYWPIIDLSAGVENLTGYSAAELLAEKGPAIGRLIHPDDLERVSVHWENCAKDNQEFFMEYRIVCKNGTVRWIADRARPERIRDGYTAQIYGFITDITARKKAEHDAKLMASLYSTLSECNRVLVHARSPDEIYEGVANVCVTQGRFALAWVGVPEHATDSVRIVAKAGRGTHYTDNLDIRLSAETPLGQGPTAIALRKKRIVVINDNTASPGDAWQTRRQYFGVEAAAAVPIIVQDDVVAVINLYSAEKMAFTTEQIALLDQLGKDISVTLARLQTEKALIEKDLVLDFALSSTIDAVWDFDSVKNEVVFSGEWEKMLGFEKGELPNNLATWESRVHPDDLKRVNAKLEDYIRGRIPVYDCEQRVLAKNGEYVWIKDRAVIVSRDETGMPVRFVGTMKNIQADIILRQTAEQNAALLESIFENSPVAISLRKADRSILRANHKLLEVFGALSADNLEKNIASAIYFDTDTMQALPERIPSILIQESAEQTVTQLVAFRRQDNDRTRWLTITAYRLDALGIVVRFGTDITAIKEAEQNLRLSESKFRRLFEALPVGVSLHATDRHVVDANPRMCEHASMSLEALKRGEHRAGKFLHPDGRQIAFADLPSTKALSENRNVENELVAYEANGMRRWFRLSVILMPESGLFAAISYDISNEVAQKEEIERSEIRFRTLFKELPVGVSLHDENRQILDANNVAMEYLGMTLEQMRAGDALRLNYFDEHGVPLSISDTPGIVALREKRNIHRRIIGFDRGNERRWVEMSVALMQRLDMFAIITHDITEERERQKRLAQSEMKFRKVFALMPVGLALFDRNKNLVEFNPRLTELTGIDGTGLYARADRKLTYRTHEGKKIPIKDLPISRALHNGKAIDDAVFGIETENSVRWVSGSLRPIEELEMFMSILTDVTEILEAREELASANANLEQRIAARTRELTEVNAELETFSYSLSHDMKAPLTRIESWANVLLEEYRAVLGENGQKMLLFLKREISGMYEMIQGMLSLARASRAELIPSRIDVSALAAEEFSLLRENYPESKIQFTVEPNLTVNADITLFTSLLRNLLENALKFSSKKPEINISVGTISGTETPALYVRDNGDGFDMRYADRLFGPFQRMHTQKEFSGTGIGLATAQRIVHRHGGRIWVESEKGVGTTVFFSMPSISPPEERK